MSGSDDLDGRTDGLIAFTGASEGAVTRLLAEGQQSHAEAALDRLQALFPERLYIEMARRGDPIEERAEAALIDLAYATRSAAGRHQSGQFRRAAFAQGA